MLAFLLACAPNTTGIDEDVHGIPRADLAGCTVTTIEESYYGDPEEPLVDTRLTYDDNGHPSLIEESEDGGEWVEVSWIETDLDGQGRPVEQRHDDIVRTWTYGEGWQTDVYEQVGPEGTYTETWTWTDNWEVFRDVVLEDGTTCSDEGELARGIRSLQWIRQCGDDTSFESRSWSEDRLVWLDRTGGEDDSNSTIRYDTSGFPTHTSAYSYTDTRTVELGELPAGQHQWECK